MNGVALKVFNISQSQQMLGKRKLSKLKSLFDATLFRVCGEGWGPNSSESHVLISIPVKPRLHERFFACNGDAIFLKIVASPARGENRMCSHPRTGDATDEKIAEKKSREIQ